MFVDLGARKPARFVRAGFLTHDFRAGFSGTIFGHHFLARFRQKKTRPPPNSGGTQSQALPETPPIWVRH